MRRAAGMTVSAVVAAVVGIAAVGMLARPAGGADGPPRVKPVTAGPLTLNARDVIAVYRPADGSSVGVLIGKPGSAVQQIVIKDFREAAAVFNELWNNEQWVKEPGDDDNRPLTRMLIKAKEGDDPAKRLSTLIINTDRVLAIALDSESRTAHVYVDRAAGAAGEETLVLPREEAEGVMAAWKACLVR